MTITDEEQPVGETTRDTDEARQTIPDDEPSVTTNVETTAISEQPPREARVTITADVVADHPIDTSDIDTGYKKDPEAKEEQQEPEVSRAGELVQQEQTRVKEPEQQPPQPESDKAAGTEQQ